MPSLYVNLPENKCKIVFIMSVNKSKGFFTTGFTNKQCTDAGMAAVLILLLIAFFSKNILYFKIAIPVLILNMIFPMLFYPFAWLWFGLSNFLGSIVSKVILTVVYIVFVFPVGLIQKLARKDKLKLAKFKQNSESAMIARDYLFTRKDIENPY